MRSITSSGTSLTVYAFGLEEHVYNGTGSNVSNTYYYTLGGRLIGKFDGTHTQYYLTDAQSSVLTTFSNAVNTTQVLGEQAYGPYGNTLSKSGSMGTAQGFTGQYQDPSGLDYYNARYYDPVIGRFISADTVQSNAQGMDPYAYVGGNPETFNDPTGNDWGGFWNGVVQTAQSLEGDVSEYAGTIDNFVRSLPTPVQDVLDNPVVDDALVITAPVWLPFVGAAAAGIVLGTVLGLGWNMLNTTTLGRADFPNPYLHLSVTPQAHIAPRPVGSSDSGSRSSGRGVRGSSGGGPPVPPARPAPPAGEGCSFTSDTPVNTSHGEQAIGDLHTGDNVWAYNPHTKKMELQPILHVWVHKDSDLIDLTITSTKKTQDKKGTTQDKEVVHTTSEHPFMTNEQGFVPAGQLHIGMHILQADGNVGVITGWNVVSGTKVMYNLEVANDHTFTVGDEQWVVHNECGPRDYQQLKENMKLQGKSITDGFQAHHIIPCAFKDNVVVQRAGFDINSGDNGIALPNSPEDAVAFEAPQHRGSHPKYSREIDSRLTDAYDTLSEEYGNFGQVPQSAARTAVDSILNDTTSAIMNAADGCGINDVFG